jgi:hypothetical protein
MCKQFHNEILIVKSKSESPDASPSGNVVGYNVYRSPDGATWKKINASLIASTLYSDSTIANSTTYYYAATAVDVYGHESSKSVALKAVIP